jgi:hypothetical protein
VGRGSARQPHGLPIRNFFQPRSPAYPPAWVTRNRRSLPTLPRTSRLCQGWRRGERKLVSADKRGVKAWSRFSRQVSRQRRDARRNESGEGKGGAAGKGGRRKELHREKYFSAPTSPPTGSISPSSAPLQSPFPPNSRPHFASLNYRTIELSNYRTIPTGAREVNRERPLGTTPHSNFVMPTPIGIDRRNLS